MSPPDARATIAVLIAEFPRFLQAFERKPPFTRYGQLEYHVTTTKMRKDHKSVASALADGMFLDHLYKTIQAWGIGSRASALRPLDEFKTALQAKTGEISALESFSIDQPDLDVDVVSKKLWLLIDGLGIVSNKTTIVPVSKTLHHLLPDLVVPIDRAYTQTFFGWNNAQFQYGQEKCFHQAFAAFVSVAKAINPAQYVGDGWNSSRTKVIDNALVGLISEVKDQVRRHSPS